MFNLLVLFVALVFTRFRLIHQLLWCNHREVRQHIPSPFCKLSERLEKPLLRTKNSKNPHSKIAKILKIDPLVRNIPEIEIQCCKMKESGKLSTQICILLPKNVFKQAVSHIHDFPSRPCVWWIHLWRWCYLWDFHNRRTINGMITFTIFKNKCSLHVTAVSWPQ